MDFPEYFTKLLKAKGMRKAELGRRIRVSQPYIYHLCTGKRNTPKPTVMAKIIKAFDEITPDETQKLMNYSYRQALGEFANSALSKDPVEVKLTGNFSTVQAVPILSWLDAAQFPKVNYSEKHEGKTITDLNGRRLFGLKVKDDTMEPEFTIDDIIIVDPDAKWKSGDYIVFRLNHNVEASFTQIKIQKGKIILHPLGLSYGSDSKFPKKEFDKRVFVIGKVVEKKKEKRY